jgi:hypothetical protein
LNTSLSAVTPSRFTGLLAISIFCPHHFGKRTAAPSRSRGLWLWRHRDREDDLIERGRVISLGQPPNRIDTLTSISGVDFESAWESRVHTVLDDQPVALWAGTTF